MSGQHGPVYGALMGVFGVVERAVNGIDSSVRGAWRALRDGPLHHLAFALVLGITGLQVIIGTAFRELDRLLSRVERGFIAVAMLFMTALSFLDYLRREIPGFTFEVDGGPNMAVVLMVWVGFFGASLATRQGKHLSVDLSERLLSPKAARLVQRFAALIAAGFCWTFSGSALALLDDSLIQNARMETMPLWDGLVLPFDTVGHILLAQDAPRQGILIGAGLALAAVIVVRRRLIRGGKSLGAPVSLALDTVGGVALLAAGLAVMGTQWTPTLEDGTPYEFVSLAEDAQTEAPSEETVANIADLVGGDTGTTDTPAEDNALEAAMAEASAKRSVPSWIPQAVLPLAFLLMALRFFGRAIIGTPADPDAAPPPMRLERTTGRGARDLIFAGLIPGVLLGIGAVMGMSQGWLIFMAAVLIVLTGAPLFLAIGIATLACVVYIQGLDGSIVAKDMFEAVKKEELLAIPFFVLAGNLMTQGSIAERLVGVARAVMGKMPGGLGLASIFACVIFAAISGSSPVTVIAVGGIMFPMLVKERYPEDYSLGVLTSAGSLGIIIPPSVPMIIYAIMVSGASLTNEATGEKEVFSVSPNDLFVAGVLPGLFIAGMLLVYTLYQTRPTRPGNRIVPPELKGGYWANLGRELRKSVWALMLPVIVLGGIYGVLGPLRFTVTEAAAVSVVYALFVELVIHRELTAKKLLDVLADSGVMMGSLFLIIVLAIAFNKFLAAEQIPQAAAEWIGGAVTERWQFLILVNLFLLALGCVMEIISAILIVAPLLAPIAASYGIDPIHFGIIFIVNLELGYLTPPMGINLFVASTVFERSVVKVMRATLPFLLLMLFCLIVIAAFPGLSLALLDRPTP